MLKNVKQFGLAGVVLIVLFVWLSTMSHASGQRYSARPEIRHEIRLPEHRTDAARAIDAYERTMERYMLLSERNLTGMNTDIKLVLAKLDSINSKINELSIRVARIEDALGIKTVSRIEKAGAKAAAEKSEKKVERATSSEGRK
jgi:hypothetical protein